MGSVPETAGIIPPVLSFLVRPPLIFPMSCSAFRGVVKIGINREFTTNSTSVQEYTTYTNCKKAECMGFSVPLLVCFYTLESLHSLLLFSPPANISSSSQNNLLGNGKFCFSKKVHRPSIFCHSQTHPLSFGTVISPTVNIWLVISTNLGRVL